VGDGGGHGFQFVGDVIVLPTRRRQQNYARSQGIPLAGPVLPHSFFEFEGLFRRQGDGWSDARHGMKSRNVESRKLKFRGQRSEVKNKS